MVVYILFSKSIQRYYIGETEDLNTRLLQHNSGAFIGSFSGRAKDWAVVLVLNCRDRTHARAIEAHIKKMKSTKYIVNLIKFKELQDKVLSIF